MGANRGAGLILQKPKIAFAGDLMNVNYDDIDRELARKVVGRVRGEAMALRASPLSCSCLWAAVVNESSFLDEFVVKRMRRFSCSMG
jgi:hypothetical protein